MRAHFDSPTHGEVSVTATWDHDWWCIETATDNDGTELDLDPSDEDRAQDALERAVEKEMQP